MCQAATTSTSDVLQKESGACSGAAFKFDQVRLPH
jgi:hypothetical protein